MVAWGEPRLGKLGTERMGLSYYVVTSASLLVTRALLLVARSYE